MLSYGRFTINFRIAVFYAYDCEKFCFIMFASLCVVRPTYCHKEVTTVPMTTIEVQYSSKFWSKIELYIVEGHGILSWFNLTTAVVS